MKYQKKLIVNIIKIVNLFDDLKEYIKHLDIQQNLENKIITTKPNEIFLTLMNHEEYLDNRMEYNTFSNNFIKNNIKLNDNPIPNKLPKIALSLNKELNRISNNYGKVSSLSRFKNNPERDKYFKLNNYYAYRNNKAKETRKIYHRVKLEPLLGRQNGKEKLAQSLFYMKKNIILYMDNFFNK
jgi:hypothetical protein